MGDIANDIIDGMCCDQCGTYFRDEASGFPRSCRDCKRENHREARAAAKPKCRCSICQKLVKQIGLLDHMRDAHGIVAAMKAALKEFK